MERKRVYITGALGFIGRTVAERYRALGASVSGMDRRAEPALDVVAGDITAHGAWQEHMAGADLVVHTAALVTNAVGFDESWKVNVLGTRRALDAARDAGVRRFVHFSSVRAFSDLGYPDGVEESWPVRPDGRPYVDTKVASEQVVLQAHAAQEVAATIVRPADVYGPGSRPWTLLPLEEAKAGRLVLPAMGRGAFSPVYIDDVVDGVLLAAEREEAAGQVFVLGGGITVRTSEFFGHYFRMLGRKGPQVLPTTVAVNLARGVAFANRTRGVESEVNADTMMYLTRHGGYSIAKAQRVLGYQPKVSLEEGMRRTEAWLRERGLL